MRVLLVDEDLERAEGLKTAQRAIANARGKSIADEFASRYGSLGEH